MKLHSLIALGALSFSAPALAMQTSATVTIHGADPFGAALIQSGDLASAERLLTSRHFQDRDPVRLLNLGAVYWRSGRRDEAVTAWREALSSPVHYDVVTAGGRRRSTDELAREALAHAPRPVMTAGR